MSDQIKKYFKLFINEDEHDYPDYGKIKWHDLIITIEDGITEIDKELSYL